MLDVRAGLSLIDTLVASPRYMLLLHDLISHHTNNTY